MYRIVVLLSCAVLAGTALWLMNLTKVSAASGNQMSSTEISEQAAVATPTQQSTAGQDEPASQQPDQGSTQQPANIRGSSSSRSASKNGGKDTASGSYGNQPYRASSSWLRSTAALTGIPVRALAGYASAQLRVAAELPACGLGWNTIAAIGAVESGHGTHAGSVIGQDGRTTIVITGPLLSSGSGFAAVGDSDDGAVDGTAGGDRAVGPMQFIPSTWARWGSDNSGDGVADVNQIDDAAWSAARYLCHVGSVGTADHWRNAIFSYNHSDVYVNQIADYANRYAAAVK